jgi:hypothetical protein
MMRIAVLKFSLQVASCLFYINATWNWDFDALEYVYHCKSCKSYIFYKMYKMPEWFKER